MEVTDNLLICILSYTYSIIIPNQSFVRKNTNLELPGFVLFALGEDRKIAIIND